MRRENADATENGSYFAWLKSSLRATAFTSFFQKALKYFRRFRLIRTLFTVFSYIFTFLGTGVALIIISVIFLVIMPILAIFGFAAVFISVFKRNKVCAFMNQELKDKKVFVFFPPRDPKYYKCPFFVGNCQDMANAENSAVIVVTPYFMLSEGIFSRHAFLTVRKESDNIYTVRKYIFFTLRKRVLERNTKRTVYFY